MARKWYAVYVGHVPGVYDEWPECQAQVSGFSDGSQKGFDSRAEAEASYLRFIAQHGIQKPAPLQKLLHNTAFDHRDRSYLLCGHSIVYIDDET